MLENERLEIVCPVGGAPANITWLALLDTADSSLRSGATGETVRRAQSWLTIFVSLQLIIESAQPRHSTTFVCIATSHSHSVDATVEVEVFAPPKIVVAPDTPRLVVAGKSVTFSCDLENADASTSVDWTHVSCATAIATQSRAAEWPQRAADQHATCARQSSPLHTGGRRVERRSLREFSPTASGDQPPRFFASAQLAAAVSRSRAETSTRSAST